MLLAVQLLWPREHHAVQSGGGDENFQPAATPNTFEGVFPRKSEELCVDKRGAGIDRKK